MRDTLAQFEISPAIADGSGLSRENRTTPREVVRMLTGMAETEHAAAFDASLAVVGRTGTVSSRMRGTAAQDKCHAKTDTLRDVSALAGYCTSTSGQRVAFAFMMNRVWPASARAIQDRMTSTLARYSG
jgi:D-alanyl-D-alanine carboxypeptidase/D-alanyl-D-alanine-endopeptidase (penicillin-binding protein 4)